jgi:hypothetical protein
MLTLNEMLIRDKIVSETSREARAEVCASLFAYLFLSISGFSRPSPSHSPAAQNPQNWGGSQSHSNAAWIPPEIKQEKSSNIENSNSNDENAQTNGWVDETRRSEESQQQIVPNSDNNINEDVQHSFLKSERNDQLEPPPEPLNENSATTPIHDEPNTNSG